MVYRAAHLVKSGVPPGKILLLTFTNKAAGEMKGRLKELLGPGLGALGGNISQLRRADPAPPCRPHRRKSNFTILDEDDSRSIFRQAAAGLHHSLGEEERRLLFRRPAGADDQPGAQPGIPYVRSSGRSILLALITIRLSRNWHRFTSREKKRATPSISMTCSCAGWSSLSTIPK